MYAIVRENSYDSAKLTRGRPDVDEFQMLHARQPGYQGTIVVELEEGRWLSVNLWDSEASASAALPAMVPAVQRLLEPMMTGPSRVIGSGPVVLTDLSKR